MKKIIPFSGSLGLGALFLAFASGCCTCSPSLPATPPPVVESPLPPDPMMSGVREWLAARHYSYVTNVVKDVTGYQMYFADHTGDPDTANCFINANSEKNLLTLIALLEPQAEDGDEEMNRRWMADKNDKSALGFFGFDNSARQMWFRISLYRPEGQVSPGELDHIIGEVMNSVHQYTDLVSTMAAVKAIESEKYASTDLTPPEEGTPGIQAVRHVHKTSAPLRLAPVNSLRRVNTVQHN